MRPTATQRRLMEDDRRLREMERAANTPIGYFKYAYELLRNGEDEQAGRVFQSIEGQLCSDIPLRVYLEYCTQLRARGLWVNSNPVDRLRVMAEVV